MKRYFGLLIMALILVSCGENKNVKQEVELSPIIKKAIGDVDSPFYGNFSQFPKEKRILPIGVFDSGLGGISVLRELMALMPEEHYLYFGDSANAPYGSKTTEQVRSLTLAAAEMLY